MMTNPTGRLTQGQFSFLPDLTDAEITLLREGMAENVKRVHIRRAAATGTAASKRAGQGVDWLDAAACEGLDWIEPFVEHKTLWHPSAV